MNALNALKVYFQPMLFYVALFMVSLVSGVSVAAQESPQKEVPPPLKVLSKEEKSSLNAQSDIKKHTILALELMDARLLKAEELNSKQDFRAMFNELGGFNALMDDTITFLNKNNSGGGKVLNNFKRIEITLRKDITRLEIIRRDLPLEYEPYVRRLTKYVREARTKAVEPLFGETVLPGNKNEQ